MTGKYNSVWQPLFEDIQLKSYLLFNMLSLHEPDQRRMVEIIGHLNKMRFGEQEQEQSKAKDTKEVRMRILREQSYILFMLQL